jgi:hypothetical protein
VSAAVNWLKGIRTRKLGSGGIVEVKLILGPTGEILARVEVRSEEVGALAPRSLSGKTSRPWLRRLLSGATVVNIADSTTPANVAHVDSSGRLQVSGAANVTNTVTTQLAPPSAYLHSVSFGLTSSRGCVVLTHPPANKAMIVRDVRVDVFSDASPGPSENVEIFRDTTCSQTVADMNPATVGETVLPFDPGLGIPAKSGLSAFAGGAVQAEVYTDGNSVASSAVPATAAPSRSQTQPQP